MIREIQTSWELCKGPSRGERETRFARRSFMSNSPHTLRHPRRAERGKGIQYGFNLLDSILDSLPLRASVDALRPGTTGMVFCPNASNRDRTEFRRGPARGTGGASGALDEPKPLFSSMSASEPEGAFYMHFNTVDVMCVD